MKSGNPVTLRDIAANAGVSRMTASKALRDAPGVSLDNRQRIKKIAKKLGYIPNAKVAAAMSAVAKTKTAHQGEKLAFLTTHKTENEWKKFAHIADCFKGAQVRALEMGYELEPFWALNPRIKLADVLYARGIDGILLAPMGPELTQVGRKTLDFDWNKFSVVEIDEHLDEPYFRLIRHNHFESMLRALYHLETMGYRRIGLALSRYVESRNRHRWISAYLLWLSVRYPDAPIPPLLHKNGTAEEFSKWVKKNKLDAVLGLPGEYHLLKESKIPCPEKLGFALLDWQDISGAEINFTGIDQNSRSLGAKAIDLLVGLIRTESKGPPSEGIQVVCGGQWVSGDTTRCVGPQLSDYSLYDSELPHSFTS